MRMLLYIFFQLSIDDKDDENSSDDVTASHGKGSDVMNLIDTLQATLKMGGKDSKSSNESRKSPEETSNGFVFNNFFVYFDGIIEQCYFQYQLFLRVIFVLFSISILFIF